MSYKSEGRKLLAKMAAREEALMEKYKDRRNPGMLGGEPWAEEARQIEQEFAESLRALREKYPDWRSELE